MNKKTKNVSNCRYLAVLCIAIFHSLPGLVLAQAVVPPGIGEAIKETQPPRPLAPQQAPAPVIIQQDEAPLRLQSSETLMVQAFRFEGADFISEEELQERVASYRGRALNMMDIEEAAGRITALYRSRGYPVARAYVPRQDARDGTLTIRLLVGKYGKVSLRNRSLVGDGLLKGALAPLEADAAVSRETLERAMLIVGDMPGAEMPRMAISPGERQGSSDLEVEVDAGKRFGAYAMADNQGSRYTGRNRLRAGVDLNSPLGIGDRLSLSGMASEGEGLANGRFAYGFPLAANGLRGEIAASKTTYELGKEYKDLDATGDAYSIEGTLSYPLIRSRERNLYLSLNLAARRMSDEIEATDTSNSRKSKVGTLGAQYESWGSLLGYSSYSGFNLGLTYGHLELLNADEEALNKAGANTGGDYGRLNLSFTGSLALSEQFSLSVALSGQKALMGKNLDGSEQMSISGTNGVKAYREVVLGDNGYLANAELRYVLPEVAGLNHSLGLFTDTGRIHLQNADYTTTNGVRLSDVGVAYYVGYKALMGSIQVARKVGPRPDVVEEDDKTRVLLQVGLAF